MRCFPGVKPAGLPVALHASKDADRRACPGGGDRSGAHCAGSRNIRLTADLGREFEREATKFSVGLVTRQ
jgi:hypothetical protein